MTILRNWDLLIQNMQNLIIEMMLEIPVHQEALIQEQMVLEVILEWVEIIDLIHEIENSEDNLQINVVIHLNLEDHHPSQIPEHQQIPTHLPTEDN